MGIIECASGASCWRGLDYYREGRVLTCNPVGRAEFDGRVQGGAEEPYEVHIDVEHARRSKCNCPHADGKRIVCKHQVALYFEAMPGAADRFEREQREAEERYWRDMARWREDRHREIVEYVNSLTKQQLRDQLIEALMDADDEEIYGRW